MTAMQPGGLELSAEEMDTLRRIAAAPEDLEKLIQIADVSRAEFLWFMSTAGLWDDPEYAETARRVLAVLEQQESRRNDGEPSRPRSFGFLQAATRQARARRQRDYRDPITLIDESIENLTDLTDWLLEDIDVGALESDLLAKDAIRATQALRAICALLPRLRIVRSNYESMPSLPDAVRPQAGIDDIVAYSRANLRALIAVGRPSEERSNPQRHRVAVPAPAEGAPECRDVASKFRAAISQYGS